MQVQIVLVVTSIIIANADREWKIVAIGITKMNETKHKTYSNTIVFQNALVRVEVNIIKT